MFKQNKGTIESFWLPARVIAISFALVILVGTFLLTLPIASRSGDFTPLVDALFTATSATCVTGLVVFDTFSHWSIFGQLVIIGLIQIGGLGLVTLTTFFNLVMGKKLGLRSMQLAQESISSTGFSDATALTRMVVIVSLTIELVGAVLLATTFVPKYGMKGIFISIFLATSAFCNAGFDVLGFESPYVSLMNYSDNMVVLGTIMLLIIVGGLGFVVWSDLYRWVKTRTLTLHTKVVLTITGILIALGTLLFLVGEWNNPTTLGSLPVESRFPNALFQSVTLRTAGFNSIDFATLRDSTKIFSGILMFIGAAPGSTGGGIKVTTIAVIAMTIICVIQGYDDTIILRRKVSKQAVYKALTIVMFGIVVVSCTAFFVTSSLAGDGIIISGADAFFESASAYATVGLSVGVTSVLNSASKLMIVLSMFLGRVGAVSFAIALAMRKPAGKKVLLPDGNIMVG